jgi:Domain of unknown function (DUF2017)
VSRGFRLDAHKRITLELVEEEAAILRSLVDQLLELMSRLPDGDPGLAELGISENTKVPEDPVLARLFPDGYQQDPAAAGEFRRYTEASLRDGKRAAAETMLKSLSGDFGTKRTITLAEAEARAWLRALNDLRLALGTRLELTEDSYERLAGLDWDDPRYAMFAIYDWLTVLQDTLVGSM